MTQLKDSKSSLRFIVIQMGARMHYAIPAILAQAGILEKFYTDICGNTGFPKVLDSFLPKSLYPKAVQRLLGRRLPTEIPSSSVTTCASTAIANGVIGKLNKNWFAFPLGIETEERVKQKLLKDQFLNANALYTNLVNSDIDLVKKAKDNGILVVHEAILNPDVGHIMREERERYPGIEKQESLESVEKGVRRDFEKWLLSDLILVPSNFVLERVVKLGGKAEKIDIVPYGIDANWFYHQSIPKKGKILFVGSVGLRKGNHYLAEATNILKKRGVKCEVRVVGPYNQETIQQPEFQGPTYIGQVPRSEVIKEFLEADIFVMPTLSEGCALVHLEAMACGVPVITTPNCGSVVRDREEGFIVPIRDAPTLADRMEQLLTDDNLRNQMSQKARERAKEFSWDKYLERLLEAFKSFENQLS
jgi:glycosyltransferase involved in cell wall biosynthesis